MTRRLSPVFLVAFAGLLAGCSEGEAPIVSPVDPSVPSIPGQDEPPDDQVKDAPDRVATVRIRLMAANITSGNAQAYLDPGIRIFQGVDPDIVMIQEFNYGSNSDAELRAFVDRAFGTDFHYYREGGAQIPNGVISRWPIVESGEWDDPQVGNRDFAWARIDIPGATDLYVVSVHLLTAGGSTRNLEAQALLSRLQALPAGAFIALGGDFNTDNRDESCLSTLGQALVTSGPYPQDRNGNSNTNASRAKPYDWLIVNSALQARAAAATVGSSTFPGGLVVDTRVYAPLADIAPALSGDSGATNMQHMAVIRDFAILSEESPPPVAEVRVLSPNGGETWAAGSSHRITWTATDVDTVEVAFAADGGSFSTIASAVPAHQGGVDFTVPATATTAARVRVTESGVPGGATDTSDGPFTITVEPPPPPAPGAVFVNEILANEPGSDTAGEFIELVNGSDDPVELGGYTLSDSRQVRHVFAAGTLLGAHQAIVVYGNASAVPPSVPNGVGSSSGVLALTNGGDTVTLHDADGAVVDSVTYGSSLASQDGLSMNRDPDADPAGTFVSHLELSPELSSPGVRVDGSSFSDPVSEPPPDDGGVTSEEEPNDAATAASGPLGLGVAASGAISTSSDVDWFRVTLPRDGRATLSLAIDGNADLDWYLYRAADASFYLTRGFTVANPEVKDVDLTAGEYLVKVVGYRGAVASYALTVSVP